MNLSQNYTAGQKTLMPVQQLKKPANKMALYENHDHFEKTIEDKFIEQLQFTEEQIKKLEKDTITNKKKWKMKSR